MKGGFVLFMNDVPYGTPVENVRAVVRAGPQLRGKPAGGSYLRKEVPAPSGPDLMIADTLREIAPPER